MGAEKERSELEGLELYNDGETELVYNSSGHGVRKKACSETVITNMEMVSCHAEIGKLGCDTILDTTQTSLVASAMLEHSLAPVSICTP